MTITTIYYQLELAVVKLIQIKNKKLFMITIKEHNSCSHNVLLSNFRPPIFEGLNIDFMQDMFKHSAIHNYSANNILIRQGDATSYIYVIIKGNLRTLRANKDGNETTINLLKEGDTYMASAIFTDEPSPMSVQILKDAQILLIPINFVKNNIKKEPQFAANLIKIITRHYKTTINQIDNISIKSPVQRIGYYLLERYLECDSNKNLSFQLPFKKSIIANHLGMTPETFSRALSEIRKIGIDVKGEKVILKDAFTLCNFCDLDLEYICNKNNKTKCSHNCPNNYNNKRAINE